MHPPCGGHYVFPIRACVAADLFVDRRRTPIFYFPANVLHGLGCDCGIEQIDETAGERANYIDSQRIGLWLSKYINWVVY